MPTQGNAEDFIAPLLGTKEDAVACMRMLSAHPGIGMIGARSAYMLTPNVGHLGEHAKRFAIPEAPVGGDALCCGRDVVGSILDRRGCVHPMRPRAGSGRCRCRCRRQCDAWAWERHRTSSRPGRRVAARLLVAEAETRIHFIFPVALESHVPLAEAMAYRPRTWSTDWSDRKVDRVLVMNLLARRCEVRAVGRKGDDAAVNYLEVSGSEGEITPVAVTGCRVRISSGGDGACICSLPREGMASCSRNGMRFAVAFVDGEHERKQVARDVEDVMSVLSDDGYVLLHDCLPNWPPAAAYPRPPGVTFWNGEVYKAVLELRCRDDLDLVVLDHDWGIAVVRKRRNPAPLSLCSLRRRRQGGGGSGCDVGGGQQLDASDISWEVAFSSAERNFRIVKWAQFLEWLAEEDEEDGVYNDAHARH